MEVKSILPAWINVIIFCMGVSKLKLNKSKQMVNVVKWNQSQYEMLLHVENFMIHSFFLYKLLRLRRLVLIPLSYI